MPVGSESTTGLSSQSRGPARPLQATRHAILTAVVLLTIPTNPSLLLGPLFLPVRLTSLGPLNFLFPGLWF